MSGRLRVRYSRRCWRAFRCSLTATGATCRIGALGWLVMGCPQLLDDPIHSSQPTDPVGSDGAGGASSIPDTNIVDSHIPDSPIPDRSVAGQVGARDAGGTAACLALAFSPPEVILNVGRSSILHGPSLSGDGLIMAYSETLDGAEDIFLSSRARRADVFGPGLAVANTNTSAGEGTTFLSADALDLYFYSDRAGGAGGRDIYTASRSRSKDDFAGAERVEGVNGDTNDQMPWVSPDRLTIYFASGRVASNASGNIWVAHRNRPGDPFDAPDELPVVNGPDADQCPALALDQLTLFFCSDRPGGAGDQDIWMATRAYLTSPFGEPFPVPGINGPSSDIDVGLSGDGRELVFSSARSGRRLLYRSLRTCF